MSKKYTKRSTAFLLSLVMLFVVFSPISASAAVKITTPKQLFVDIGGTAQINIVTSPAADRTALGLVYKSANEKIATVDSMGLVSGIGKGSTTLTVQYGKKSVKVTALVSEKGVAYTDGATFSIEYPESWTVVENVLNSKVIDFISPQVSSSDQFKENLSVSKEDLSATPMNVEEYTGYSIPLIKKLFSNVKILSNQKSKVSGYEARSIIYTLKLGIYNLKYLQVYTVVNNQSHILTYTAGKSDFDDSIIEAQKMINSFKVLG